MLCRGGVRATTLVESRVTVFFADFTKQWCSSAPRSGGVGDSKAPLFNSMSDGFYDVPTRPGANADRPLAADAGVRVARARHATSMSEPEVLGNSMSEGTYDTTRRLPRFLRNSLSDPMDNFLQNSLAGDSNYQMPQSLRSSPRRGQGFGAARPRPVMQRIVAAPRSSMREPEPLHNSYSAVDYAEQRKKK